MQLNETSESSAFAATSAQQVVCALHLSFSIGQAAATMAFFPSFSAGWLAS